MTTIPAIGLSGFAQSGKTTVANYLNQHYGYERKHIAEPLRDMLSIFLAHAGVADHMIPRYLTGDLKENVIPEIGVSGRRLQITLGTEWGRELVAADIWAKLWGIQAKSARATVMNDSVRFPNEEDSIRALGGFTILINRKGTGPIAYKWGVFGRLLYRWFGCLWGVHDSERTDRLSPDYTINNDGALEELYQELDDIILDRFLSIGK